jgi:V-type H+-transporting ATPase subunit e
MGVAAWFFSPKGEYQVYAPLPPLYYPFHSLHHQPTIANGTELSSSSRLWRSSIILSIASCYLMWAVTFLAQLHPLIEPRRSDLRKEFIHH